MNLHSNKELLQDAIQAAAASLGIREIYVEKDYWVTVALYEVFHSDMASQVVFKGGTALSKCYRLIERFSEDVDLVVLRNEGENDNQLKKKIRAVGKIAGEVMPEITVDGLTNKRGNIRKTVHQYDRLYDGNFGQAREHVVLETTWLGSFEPYFDLPISSYVGEMMREKGQEAFIREYRMAPFTIQVLGKTRTFCEKVMGLVRFSRTNDPITALRNKIRHVYDLHQLLKDEEVAAFFASSDFDDMLTKVGNDDIVSYKNNNSWVSEHPATALLFAKPDETWLQLSTTYHTSFKELVTGKLPPEVELIATLKTVEGRLRRVGWSIG